MTSRTTEQEQIVLEALDGLAELTLEREGVYVISKTYEDEWGFDKEANVILEKLAAQAHQLGIEEGRRLEREKRKVLYRCQEHAVPFYSMEELEEHLKVVHRGEPATGGKEV